MAPTIGARRGADDTTVTDVATQFGIVTGRTYSIRSSKFIEYSYSSVIRLTSNFGNLTINFAAHSARLCKLTKRQPVVAGGPEHVAPDVDRRGQSIFLRDRMTFHTGAIRFVSLAMLITATGLFLLNYLSM